MRLDVMWVSVALKTSDFMEFRAWNRNLLKQNAMTENSLYGTEFFFIVNIWIKKKHFGMHNSHAVPIACVNNNETERSKKI